MVSTAGDGDDPVADDPVAIVRRVLAENIYVVLGTADREGRPWASPVFYAADGPRVLYWMSSPDVTHSRNLAGRPELSMIVFDSRTPVGTGETTAVYMAGTATEVPAGELDGALAACRPPFADRGGRDLTAGDLRSPSPYRLYRATATEHFVLCPRATGEPCAEHGKTYDHRTRVRLP